jgi:hypothetical protein
MRHVNMGSGDQRHGSAKPTRSGVDGPAADQGGRSPDSAGRARRRASLSGSKRTGHGWPSPGYGRPRTARSGAAPLGWASSAEDRYRNGGPTESRKAGTQGSNGWRTGKAKGTRTRKGRRTAQLGAGQPGGGSFEGRARRLQTKGPVIGSGHEATGRRATREQTVAVRSRGVPDDGHARALAKHTVDTEQQQERTRHPWLNSRSISFPAFPTTTAS